jgi:uncharacterized sporulation protein YeaH/YhbH (DUF444 family)
MEDKINSNESEGAFNDFIRDQLDDLVEDIIKTGDLDRFTDRSSDIIIEMDDIAPPVFTYDENGGYGSGTGRGPGKDKGKLRFSFPYKDFMDLLADKLNLPNLLKEGEGKIKQISYTYKTFGSIGVIMDKKRTFKRALRTSIGTNLYNPDEDKYTVLIRRQDRRFKLPQREEKPKYKAVVFYIGDISYSVYGERLELEKRVINFIHHWLDYNYGPGNVEHRFVVHDVEAHEVDPADFYRVTISGGTLAHVAFDFVYQLAFNEYDIGSTNYYVFYFGDGELFGDDARKIAEIVRTNLRPMFNRIGIVEVKPSTISQLNKELNKEFSIDNIVRISTIRNQGETVSVIKTLFGKYNA